MFPVTDASASMGGGVRGLSSAGVHVLSAPDRTASTVDKGVAAEAVLADATSTPPDTFGAALHSLGAFGTATLAVVGIFGVGIWGVRWGLGVGTVQEFADLMRDKLRVRMPGLSSSLHPPPDSDFDLEPHSPSHSSSDSRTPIDANPHLSSPSSNSPPSPNSSASPWAWPAAQERLTAAYEQGGVVGWAERMVSEMEAEDREGRKAHYSAAERKKREGEGATSTAASGGR